MIEKIVSIFEKKRNHQNQNKCVQEMLRLNLSCKQRSIEDDIISAAKCEAIKVTELQKQFIF